MARNTDSPWPHNGGYNGESDHRDLEPPIHCSRLSPSAFSARAILLRYLAIMDHVSKTGESVLITKRGKPVAKLVPAKRQRDDIFGDMAGKTKIVGDIVGPVTPLEDWETK